MKHPSTITITSAFAAATRVTMTAFALLLAITLSPAGARAEDNRAPDVPPSLAVPDGNKVHFQVHAEGVQIYVCRNIGTAEVPQYAWVFKAPEAILFEGKSGIVGIHYAGPTWESTSGSKVVGARVAGATVDATAIPWLLLRAVSAEGPGIFARTTFIQRVNTTGGLAPTTGADAAHLGQEARVPYAADYYFFRAQ